MALVDKDPTIKVYRRGRDQYVFHKPNNVLVNNMFREIDEVYDLFEDDWEIYHELYDFKWALEHHDKYDLVNVNWDSRYIWHKNKNYLRKVVEATGFSISFRLSDVSDKKQWRIK
jgi:hypothetical protein